MKNEDQLKTEKHLIRDKSPFIEISFLLPPQRVQPFPMIGTQFDSYNEIGTLNSLPETIITYNTHKKQKQKTSSPEEL